MIAGIGGIGAGAVAPTAMTGMGVNGGLNGPLGALNVTPLSGAATVQLQQLSELIEGFSSAQILMALMLASASKKQCGDDNGPGALALLAGMALASQLGGLQGLQGIGPTPGASAGETGGQFSALA